MVGGRGGYTRLDPEDYRNVLRVFYAHSTHHERTRDFVLEYVLPRLPHGAPCACLDVGCGEGRVSDLLAPSFDRVLAVDSNPAYFAGGGGSSGGQPGNVERWVGDFLDDSSVRLDEPVALVLCIHVLYQMPRHVIKEMLCKMLRCATPGGFLLIVHAANHGQAHAFKVEVNPQLETSADIKQLLDELGCEYEVAPCPTPMPLESLDQARLVLRFMVQEDCSGPDWPGLPEERIEELIEKHVALLPRGNSNGSEWGSNEGVRESNGGARGDVGSADCASRGADNGCVQGGGSGAGFQRYYILQDDSEFILVHKPQEA